MGRGTAGRDQSARASARMGGEGEQGNLVVYLINTQHGARKKNWATAGRAGPGQSNHRSLLESVVTRSLDHCEITPNRQTIWQPAPPLGLAHNLVHQTTPTDDSSLEKTPRSSAHRLSFFRSRTEHYTEKGGDCRRGGIYIKTSRAIPSSSVLFSLIR